MAIRENYAIAALIFLSAVALVTVDFQSFLTLSFDDFAGIGLLLILALIAEAVSLQYESRGAKFTSSIAFLPIFAVATLFGAAAATWSILIVMGVAEGRFRKRPFRLAAFNAAQAVVAMRAGSELYHYVQTFGNSALVVAIGFAGLTVTFFVINLLAVAGILAGRRSAGLFQTLVAIGESGAFDLLYDLLVSPIALVIHYLYVEAGILGILVVVLPLFIIRHSYFARLQLQQANTALLKVLIKAIETRDPYTSGHSVRVSQLAKSIGIDHGLRRTELEQLEAAALLHDVGKVDGVYADLIKKPSGLTDDEVQVIRTHATRGADFLASLAIFSDKTLNGIRHHHERYDGTGYPAGLKGEDIPLFARIIQVCDSVDAMLSDRPYRKALPVEAVSMELKRCAGTQFDPELVELIVAEKTLQRTVQSLTFPKQAPEPVIA